MSRLIPVFLAAFALTACDTVEESNPPIEVGVLLSLSGPLSSNGDALLRGMELAREEVNASKLLGHDASLEFVIRDDMGIPGNTIRQLQELAEHEGVPAILGPRTSPSVADIARALSQERMVALSPGSNAPGFGIPRPFLFLSSLTVERLVHSGIEATKQSLGYSRVAVVHNRFEFTMGSSISDFLSSALARYPDVRIVAEVVFLRDLRSDSVPVPDLSAEMATLKAANPEAIFVLGNAIERTGVLLQMHAAGITQTPAIVPLLSSDDVKQVNQQATGAAEGAVTLQAWLAASEHPRSLAFLKSYRERYGEEPGDYAARGYASAHILANALANAESFESDAIREALAETRNLDTIFGPFSFDENGEAVYEPVVGQVKGNEFVILK